MAAEGDYFTFLSVKLFAIAYYSVIYFILGFGVSVLLNKLMPNLDVPKEHLENKEEKKEDETEKKEEAPEKKPEISNGRLILEIILNFALIGISFFFVRKIVKNYIPFPLEGVAGFEKARLKELQGGIIIAAIYFAFQTKLIDKLKYFKKEMSL